MHHITIPENIIFILDRLKVSGYEAYLVGGCVRDQLMGKNPHDYDITTNALPEAVKACFADLPVIETGLKHGTVTVISDGQAVEVTTFRTDGKYLDNRRPENVTFVSDLESDLSRRDFTVNALAYSPDKGLIDLFCGINDINNGIIRCVGIPEKRFNEDGLRIMRAIRFASKLDFTIEKHTENAIISCRSLLDNIAAERIFIELKGLLVGIGAERVLTEYKDVLFQIIPELASMSNHPQNNPHHIYDVWTHTVKAICASEYDEILRLALLFHDSGKPHCHTTDEKGIDHFHGHPEVSAEIAAKVLSRFRCDNATRDEVLFLIKYHDIRPSPYDKRLKKLIAKMGEERFKRLLQIKRADTIAHAPNSRDKTLLDIERYERVLMEMKNSGTCMNIKDMAINGSDLIALGIPQGKTIGVILEQIFDLVCTDSLPNSREQLLNEARRMISTNKI